jgi:hypothetical protein
MIILDYLAQYGNVPDDIWMWATAEGQCLEIQIAFLEEIGGRNLYKPRKISKGHRLLEYT